MQLIDTHIHINFDRFDSDRLEVVTRWRDAGVVQLVHSCVSPGEFTSIATLAAMVKELYFAVGLHPLETQQWSCSQAEVIKNLAQSNPKVVAIGETGLDFYKADNHEQQHAAFAAQLAIAQALDLPVIIHCREAAVQTAEQLQAAIAPGKKLRGVMHCWGGTPEETQWFLDLGLYISFSGTVTFKNAVGIKSSCMMVPPDRLLIETDCPFLAPVPKRGKRNEPAYVRHVASEVAKLRGVPVETVAAQTTANARQLFGLPEIVPERCGQSEKEPRG
ncbi:MAG: TatD family hydrolase [Hormoscilla sp.]